MASSFTLCSKLQLFPDESYTPCISLFDDKMGMTRLRNRISNEYACSICFLNENRKIEVPAVFPWCSAISHEGIYFSEEIPAEDQLVTLKSFDTEYTKCISKCLSQQYYSAFTWNVGEDTLVCRKSHYGFDTFTAEGRAIESVTFGQPAKGMHGLASSKGLVYFCGTEKSHSEVSVWSQDGRVNSFSVPVSDIEDLSIYKDYLIFVSSNEEVTITDKEGRFVTNINQGKRNFACAAQDTMFVISAYEGLFCWK